jgi:hypothetical protein
LDHSYYKTIPMAVWFLSRRFFDNSANYDALLTLSTIMVEFLFGMKITNLVEVHPMNIHVCFHLSHRMGLKYKKLTGDARQRTQSDNRSSYGPLNRMS